MFSRTLDRQGAAALIERFLSNESSYPQEWNDFVENRQSESHVEVARKRCDELDPLVNRPGKADEQASLELVAVVEKLRSTL